MRLHEAIDKLLEATRDEQGRRPLIEHQEIRSLLTLCRELSDDTEVWDTFVLAYERDSPSKVVFLTNSALIQIDGQITRHHLQDFERVEIDVQRYSNRGRVELRINRHKSREGVSIFSWVSREGAQDYEDFKRLARALLSLVPHP